MVDTRPALSDAEFEAEASFIEEDFWLTGDSLIYRPAVMDVPEWDFYNSVGYLSLTRAQRVLMAWADIVGQISNGGFEQLCANYTKELVVFADAVNALNWPELQEYYTASLREYRGGKSTSRRRKRVALSDDPEKWAKSREHLIQHLIRSMESETEESEPSTSASRKHRLKYLGRAMQEKADLRRAKSWNPFKPKPQPKTAREWMFELYDDADLQQMYIQCVMHGEFESGGERYFDHSRPETVAATAFDQWFCSDECKGASKHYVYDFIMNNRNELYQSA